MFFLVEVTEESESRSAKGTICLSKSPFIGTAHDIESLKEMEQNGLSPNERLTNWSALVSEVASNQILEIGLKIVA